MQPKTLCVTSSRKLPPSTNMVPHHSAMSTETLVPCTTLRPAAIGIRPPPDAFHKPLQNPVSHTAIDAAITSWPPIIDQPSPKNKISCHVVHIKKKQDKIYCSQCPPKETGHSSKQWIRHFHDKGSFGAPSPWTPSLVCASMLSSSSGKASVRFVHRSL